MLASNIAPDSIGCARHVRARRPATCDVHRPLRGVGLDLARHQDRTARPAASLVRRDPHGARVRAHRALRNRQNRARRGPGTNSPAPVGRTAPDRRQLRMHLRRRTVDRVGPHGRALRDLPALGGILRPPDASRRAPHAPRRGVRGAGAGRRGHHRGAVPPASRVRSDGPARARQRPRALRGARRRLFERVREEAPRDGPGDLDHLAPAPVGLEPAPRPRGGLRARRDAALDALGDRLPSLPRDPGHGPAVRGSLLAAASASRCRSSARFPSSTRSSPSLSAA